MELQPQIHAPIRQVGLSTGTEKKTRIGYAADYGKIVAIAQHIRRDYGDVQMYNQILAHILIMSLTGLKLSEWERAEFYELYTDQKGISHRNVITVRGNNGASPSRAVAYGSKLDDVLIKSKVQRCIYIAQCIKKELWVMPSGKQADSYRAYIACMRAAFNRSVKAVFPKMRSILSFQSCRLSFMNDLVNAGYGHHEIAEICGATRGELKCIENIRNDVSSRKEIYCINSKYD